MSIVIFMIDVAAVPPINRIVYIICPHITAVFSIRRIIETFTKYKGKSISNNTHKAKKCEASYEG